jgi:hypothetical protein
MLDLKARVWEAEFLLATSALDELASWDVWQERSRMELKTSSHQAV